MVRVGVRDHHDIDVARCQPDRGEVGEQAAAVRAHGLAGAGLEEDAPAARLDQERVQVQGHVIGRQEGSPQYHLQLGFRRFAGVDARRAANEPVAQHGRGDLAHPEAVKCGIARCRESRLRSSPGADARSGGETGRAACQRQHNEPAVNGKGRHLISPSASRDQS